MGEEIRGEKRRPWWDRAGASLLFLGTAAVVLWQNTRLAVLWDASYILENSRRISLGDIPYRDFPFPYAPGTFLIQALLIRVTGRVFFHHVVYCAIVGGLGTILAWRILLELLREAVPSFRLVAIYLAAPLTVLGIYCIFPHPFYDPDCTFAILCCIFLLLRLERNSIRTASAFFTGVACVVPLFVKQNTGSAFLASVAAMVVILILHAAWKRQRVTGLANLLAGLASGLAAAVLLLHFTAGLHNYARWTIQFAAARRLPRLADMFAPYWNPLILVWLAAFAAAFFLLRSGRLDHAAWRLVWTGLISAPFAWAVLYLLVDTDASERAERLLALWPVVLVVSLILAIQCAARELTVKTLLPFILIATIQGAFLSQQLWGSTYAIWPLLVFLLAGILAQLASFQKKRPPREIVWLAGVVSLCLLIAGGFYAASHERLDYADVSTGEIVRSNLPALAGLSMRGPWIPEFEELVHFSDREIPRDQGLLMIPGEDLFYYATGRRPRFPVLMFDHTVNPYTPEQILELSRSWNICWLVLKKQLQLNADPVEDHIRLLDLLRGDFAPVESVANYDIYRRTTGNGCSESFHSQPRKN